MQAFSRSSQPEWHRTPRDSFRKTPPPFCPSFLQFLLHSFLLLSFLLLPSFMSSFLPSLSPSPCSILSLIPSFFYALFHHSFHSSFFCLTLSFFPSLTHIPTVIYFIFASIILSFFHSSCPSFHLLFHHVLSVLPCIPHAIHPPYFFHPLINQPFCLSSFVSHFIRLLLHHRSEHRDPRLQQCRGLVLWPECCSAGFGCGVTAKTALSIQ